MGVDWEPEIFVSEHFHKYGLEQPIKEDSMTFVPRTGDGLLGSRPNTTFEPLLDSHQASKLLCIHHKTLSRMARLRLIPAARIGKLWRFRASELDLWIEQKLIQNSK